MPLWVRVLFLVLWGSFIVAAGPVGVDHGDPPAEGATLPAAGDPVGRGPVGSSEGQDPDDVPDEHPPAEDGLLAGSLVLRGHRSSGPVGASEVLGPGSDRRRRVFRPPA